MFEIGRYYVIRVGEGDNWLERLYLVKEFTGTLLRAESTRGEIIFNTAAPTFQSAYLDSRDVSGNIYADSFAEESAMKGGIRDGSEA